MTTRRRPDAALISAGIALIVLPLLGTFFKLAWPGWYLFFILFAAPLLILVYALLVVIAATGFLTPRAAFRPAGSSRIRALTAAWLTSAGVVVAAFFFVDGGDTSYGSAFMYLTGIDGDGAVSAISSVISLIATIPWVGGAVWLIVEWIVALVVRRRAART